MASTISAGTSAGTAIAIAGDTSGALALQTNNGTTAVTIDTSQNVFVGGTTQNTANNPVYSKTTVKAWVHFLASGTIQASFNVSSITVNSTGSYTVNMTNALQDTNYCVVNSSGYDSPTIENLTCTGGINSSSNFNIYGFRRSNGTTTTTSDIMVAVFR